MKEHVLTPSTNPQKKGMNGFKVTQALVALGLEDKDEIFKSFHSMRNYIQNLYCLNESVLHEYASLKNSYERHSKTTMQQYIYHCNSRTFSTCIL